MTHQSGRKIMTLNSDVTEKQRLLCKLFFLFFWSKAIITVAWGDAGLVNNPEDGRIEWPLYRETVARNNGFVCHGSVSRDVLELLFSQKVA